jgi:hypothetical protein
MKTTSFAHPPGYIGPARQLTARNLVFGHTILQDNVDRDPATLRYLKEVTDVYFSDRHKVLKDSVLKDRLKAPMAEVFVVPEAPMLWDPAMPFIVRTPHLQALSWSYPPSGLYRAVKNFPRQSLIPLKENPRDALIDGRYVLRATVPWDLLIIDADHRANFPGFIPKDYLTFEDRQTKQTHNYCSFVDALVADAHQQTKPVPPTKLNAAKIGLLLFLHHPSRGTLFMQDVTNVESPEVCVQGLLAYCQEEPNCVLGLVSGTRSRFTAAEDPLLAFLETWEEAQMPARQVGLAQSEAAFVWDPKQGLRFSADSLLLIDLQTTPIERLQMTHERFTQIFDNELNLDLDSVERQHFERWILPRLTILSAHNRDEAEKLLRQFIQDVFECGSTEEWDAVLTAWQENLP